MRSFSSTAATLTLGYTILEGISSTSLNWSGKFEGSTSGQGAVRSVTTPNPGAAETGNTGGEWTETVPTGARWKVKISSADFSASATVAGRTPTIQIRDDSDNVRYVFLFPNVTAGQGRTALAGSIGYVQTSWDGGNFGRAGGPKELLIQAGWNIHSFVTGSLIQMGDSWTTISHLVEEWLEP